MEESPQLIVPFEIPCMMSDTEPPPDDLRTLPFPLVDAVADGAETASFTDSTSDLYAFLLIAISLTFRSFETM
jgi:hypothetical protein